MRYRRHAAMVMVGSVVTAACVLTLFVSVAPKPPGPKADRQVAPERVTLYSVGAGRTLRILLQEGQDVVRIHTHAILSDALEEVQYPLLVSLSGSPAWQHEFFVESRIAASAREAEVANATSREDDKPVADERTTLVHLPQFSGTRTLIIEGPPQREVLVRVYRVSARDFEEREAVLRTLPPNRVTQKIRRSTFTPWAMLSRQQRLRRLRHDSLRLFAEGQPNVDFFTKSIFFSGSRAAPRFGTAESRISKTKAYTFDVVGPRVVKVRSTSAVKAERVTSSAVEPLPLRTTRASDVYTLALDEGVHTIRLTSDSPLPRKITVDAGEDAPVVRRSVARREYWVDSRPVVYRMAATHPGIMRTWLRAVDAPAVVRVRALGRRNIVLGEEFAALDGMTKPLFHADGEGHVKSPVGAALRREIAFPRGTELIEVSADAPVLMRADYHLHVRRQPSDDDDIKRWYPAKAFGHNELAAQKRILTVHSQPDVRAPQPTLTARTSVTPRKANEKFVLVMPQTMPSEWRKPYVAMLADGQTVLRPRSEASRVRYRIDAADVGKVVVVRTPSGFETRHKMTRRRGSFLIQGPARAPLTVSVPPHAGVIVCDCLPQARRDLRMVRRVIRLSGTTRLRVPAKPGTLRRLRISALFRRPPTLTLTRSLAQTLRVAEKVTRFKAEATLRKEPRRAQLFDRTGDSVAFGDAVSLWLREDVSGQHQFVTVRSDRPVWIYATLETYR